MSVSEFIRDAVDRALDEDAKWEQALSIVGKFHSGRHDIAENHDDYLVEAYLS